jgi:monovalent cation/hydrogen antiporter
VKLTGLWNQLESLSVLLAAVAGLTLLARAVKVPYSIVLVLAGLGLGWVPGWPKLRLSPEVFLLLILPLLIYPAAVAMPWRELRHNLRPISLLAVGLVLCTMVTVGWIAHQSIPGMPLSSAFVLGAIVSPTDPLSTPAIARRLKVPQRIQNLLEGESLVNDSTGLVCYRLALAAVVGGSFAYLQGLLQFLQMTGGGLLLGLAVGWGVVQIQRRIDDTPVEITISLLTPFAAYLPAERVGVSGVLAVVAAGLYVGWNSPLIHKAQTRLHAAPFWGMLQFLLNGLVFLLVGEELPELVHGIHGASAATLAWQAALLSASVILIRILWTFAAAYPPRWLSRHLREQDPFPDWRNVALVAWTGTRGAVSLAAALALPHTTSSGAPFPARSSIQFLTYCVILATLVVQGLSLPKVIGWLKVTGGDEAAREESEARKRATQAVLGYLESQQGQEPKAALDKLLAEYAERLEQLELEQDEAEAEASAPASAAYRRLQRAALERERRTLLELRNQHLINDEVLRRIQHDIDLAEDRLRHQT